MTLGTLSVCLSLSLSLCLLSFSASLCLSVSLCPSVSLSLSLFLCLCLFLSMCLCLSPENCYCPEDIMEKFKQTILHLIGLDFFSEGAIFPGLACYQERGTLQFQILVLPAF